MSTQALQWKDNLFYKNDQPIHMISGEFHYFRVPKADWRIRLQQWKEAGGTSVATYIPWLIHEPEEGKFAFGEHDYDDLEGFLQICLDEQIDVIVRPGPYQYSELLYAGLPEWLCKDYPEILATKFDGTSFNSFSVSYTHPLFLKKAHKWISYVCNLLSPWCATKGGPITAIQIDNEAVGIHCWHNPDKYDYNTETFGFQNENGRWPLWLKSKYHTISNLNTAWNTDYQSFAEAMPMTSPAGTKFEVRRVSDFEQCYLHQISDYFQILADWMIESGIDVPFIHNSPNPEDNQHFYEVVDRLGPQFLLGSDHYYNLNQNWKQNNPTPQYAVRCFTSLEVLRNMGMPPTVLEMPSGSAADWPPIFPHDARAAYLANIAMGMKGWNYYILTGGPNVPNTGETTDIYDYGASISATGELRPLYYVQQDVHQLCHKYHTEKSRLISDFTVAYTHEMLRSDSYESLRDDSFVSPGYAWETTYKGVVTTSFCSGITPELCDISFRVPDTKKPLWIVTCSIMAERAQRNLVSFLEQGGNLILGPELPVMDENLMPCTILSEALGIDTQMLHKETECLVDMNGINNVMASYCCSINKPDPLQVLAWNRKNNHTLAAKYNVLGGSVIWCGVAWSHSRYEHNDALMQILQSVNVTPRICKSEKNVFTVLHQCEDHYILFVLNLYSSPTVTDVTIHINNKVNQLKNIQLNPMEVKLFSLKF